MPSRRYYIASAPIEHINGKLDRVAVKCPNTDNPDEQLCEGFFYGYRRKGSSVSRFGHRQLARLLLDNPYTANELDNQDAFAGAVSLARTKKGIPRDWLRAVRAFNAQSAYISLWGFVIASIIKNGGVWPF